LLAISGGRACPWVCVSMNDAMSIWDLVVLGIYLTSMVAMGVWVGRRNTSPEQFMKAGGRIPGWAVGLSIFGTYVSSISFLALPGKSFGGDWNVFVFSLAIPLPAWLAVRWFVPFYRRHGEISAYHHLEQRFGAWARTYAVLCYLLTQLARMGTIMYLLALALAPLTGWDLVTLILVTGGVTVMYTLVGGMEAVIWADVVQSVVLIGGAVACAVLLMFGMPEGPGQVFRVAAEHDKFSLGSWGASLAAPTVWVVLLYGIFMNLQNFGIDQSFVQRYATARSDTEARRSVWLGAMLYLPISGLFLFIGTALFAYYTVQPGLLAPELDPMAKPDAVFPYFLSTGLPVGVSGLVIAAVFAAAQSTLSSTMNCSATLFLCDLYRRYWRPTISERGSMWVLRLATLGFGAGGTVMALAMIRVRSALDVWWELAGVFSGGMLGLFLLGMIAKHATRPAAVTGTVLGILVICWMSLSPRLAAAGSMWRSPFHSFMVIVVGTLTILLVGLMLSRRRTSRVDAGEGGD
jgi:solute:Na+ symporter, SSS family